MDSATEYTAVTHPLLAIQNLEVKRGRQTVLTIDQLHIPKGDVLAVVGPNGAGKSTFLHVLARLLRPSSGTILFNGRATAQESDLVYRRRIGLVLQAPLLFDMTVFDNVALGLRFRRVDKQAMGMAVNGWLERLGIAELRDRRGHELSGGEAQRVSLARAMVLEPDLLLLDEPFSALDPPTHKRLLAELSVVLDETETTAVLVTHDLNEAQRLGKRIGVVLNGRLAASGQLEALQQHRDTAVRQFLQQDEL